MRYYAHLFRWDALFVDTDDEVGVGLVEVVSSEGRGKSGCAVWMAG